MLLKIASPQLGVEKPARGARGQAAAFCNFVRKVAFAALYAEFQSEGKEGTATRPEGFR